MKLLSAGLFTSIFALGLSATAVEASINHVGFYAGKGLFLTKVRHSEKSAFLENFSLLNQWNRNQVLLIQDRAVTYSQEASDAGQVLEAAYGNYQLIKAVHDIPRRNEFSYFVDNEEMASAKADVEKIEEIILGGFPELSKQSLWRSAEDTNSEMLWALNHYPGKANTAGLKKEISRALGELSSVRKILSGENLNDVEKDF